MSFQTESVVCAICGADDYKLISNKGQFGLPLQVVLCKKCGLGYLNPRWNREGYLNFYKSEYDKYYRPHLTKKGITHEVAPNAIIKRLEQNSAIPSEVLNILDIGSGAGGNLLALGARFPTANLFAIEPSAESQEQLKTMNVEMVGE